MSFPAASFTFVPLLSSGSLEFVNMAAEVGVLLFNMNNRVFVKEQLVPKSLKTKDKSTYESIYTRTEALQTFVYTTQVTHFIPRFNQINCPQ